jgi:hypothetical protein
MEFVEVETGWVPDRSGVSAWAVVLSRCMTQSQPAAHGPVPAFVPPAAERSFTLAFEPENPHRSGSNRCVKRSVTTPAKVCFVSLADIAAELPIGRFYPRKQTSPKTVVMSAKCHVWTYMDPARLQPCSACSGSKATTADVYPAS